MPTILMNHQTEGGEMKINTAEFIKEMQEMRWLTGSCGPVFTPQQVSIIENGLMKYAMLQQDSRGLMASLIQTNEPV